MQVRLDCTIDIHSKISKGLLYCLRNKMKSVLCEMKICTLRNGNLYLAKWKSVLCEIEICTLRNGNLYFVRWKSVLCKMKLLLSNFMKNLCEEASANLVFTDSRDRDTRFSFLSRHRTASSWCLENADLKTWDRRRKQNNFSQLHGLPQIASAKLAEISRRMLSIF